MRIGFTDVFIGIASRDHFVNASCQWERTLHCNIVSHWLGAYTKWSLCLVLVGQVKIYPVKFVYSLVLLCFVLFMATGIKRPILFFTPILHGSLTGIGVISWLPLCQWCKYDEYCQKWLLSKCKQRMCTILGVYSVCHCIHCVLQLNFWSVCSIVCYNPHRPLKTGFHPMAANVAFILLWLSSEHGIYRP